MNEIAFVHALGCPSDKLTILRCKCIPPWRRILNEIVENYYPHVKELCTMIEPTTLHFAHIYTNRGEKVYIMFVEFWCWVLELYQSGELQEACLSMATGKREDGTLVIHVPIPETIGQVLDSFEEIEHELSIATGRLTLNPMVPVWKFKDVNVLQGKLPNIEARRKKRRHKR